jgi:hypothetical protein
MEKGTPDLKVVYNSGVIQAGSQRAAHGGRPLSLCKGMGGAEEEQIPRCARNDNSYGYELPVKHDHLGGGL